MIMRKNSNNWVSIYLFTVSLGLFSCKQESAKEVNLNNEKYGSFNGFKIEKINQKSYKIKLGSKDENKHVLFFEKDTVFISFYDTREIKKHLLFIKNNFKEESDTIKNLKNKTPIILVRKPNLKYENICNSNIIFTSNKSFSNGYTIWYSFEKGILQVLTKSPSCIEILSLNPNLNYKIVERKNDILDL